MNEIHKNRSGVDEIDIGELISALWKGKWIIAVATSLATAAAVFYALSLPNIYKSEALLAPVTEDAGMKIPGQLGGLAALAGVNLGGLAGSNKVGLAMEIIKSREFLGHFIEKNDLYVTLMATEGWNRSDNSFLIDPDIYDVANNKWVRKVEVPYAPKPSLLEVHEEFMKSFTITQEKASGMVKIGFEHYSPYLAKRLIDDLIQAINDEMRNRDLVEAQRSISYLNNQIEKTNISDVKTMLYSLIEEQTKTVMLANVRDEYIFKVVDPAVVVEKKIKPARVGIIIIVSMCAFILSCMLMIFSSQRARFYSGNGK